MPSFVSSDLCRPRLFCPLSPKNFQRAEKILQKLGLTPTDAVNILLAQIEIRQGLPFEVSVQRKSLLTADEQAAAWTENYGAY